VGYCDLRPLLHGVERRIQVRGWMGRTYREGKGKGRRLRGFTGRSGVSVLLRGHWSFVARCLWRIWGRGGCTGRFYL